MLFREIREKSDQLARRELNTCGSKLASDLEETASRNENHEHCPPYRSFLSLFSKCTSTGLSYCWIYINSAFRVFDQTLKRCENM